MQKLKSAIHGNYTERVEVRRQLLELNDLNLNNKIQISKRQLEVHRWEKENVGTDNPVPSWVAAAGAGVVMDSGARIGRHVRAG